MPTSTVSPVTSTTLHLNTTIATKSRQQILIQTQCCSSTGSGAMIAVIVIGIIIILTILLLILKTYNRCTHASRVLGHSGGSKPRPKTSQSTGQTSLPLNTIPVNSRSNPLPDSNPPSEHGFQLPRVELSSVEGNQLEQFSTASGSTVVTIHDSPSLGNT
ncbi:noncompact myelin-associated protein isoform X1 [Synchiropus splendidus]|uniref:noncompact myelin-associated protein isoform X1 n=1 Tax=Synchiropus splendidus TaxID=270530 RepID=UPI00237EDC09|nr:noncompact myelin-associated protein isoform X1 [Synchiropus splendidus]